MRGASGDALEWALALLHTPGERHVLRKRPLPGGMTRLLSVAAGSPSEVLAEAAREFGESEARIREAARFYACEVLFHPQADAYRVLGVDSKADAGQIKTHYRLLQQWLHPDRRRGGDEAVFATSVNSAWNYLRSEERRRAYDQARREKRQPEVVAGSDAWHRAPAWGLLPEDRPASERWRRRVPAITLVAACAILCWMILRDAERRPAVWESIGGERERAAQDGGLIRMPSKSSADVPRTSSALRKSTSPAGMMPARPNNQPAASVAQPEALRWQMPVVVAPEPSPAAPVASSTMPREAPPDEARREQVVPATQTAAETKPPGKQQPDFARIQLARQTGDQLLDYLGHRNQPPPPIWNSPKIQSAALRVREELHAQGSIRLVATEWRVGSSASTMHSTWKQRGGETTGSGLVADLVWRDNQWLVTGLSLEQMQ